MGEAEKATTAMAISPDEIENQVFSLVRRGYDPAEVDDFLKDVAAMLAQTSRGLGTPPPPVTDAPDASPPPPTLTGRADDFERMGEHVAAILRQAHESVATMRHRAEADAALIREDAQRELADLKEQAEADRQAAAGELEAARAEAALILSDVRHEAARIAESTAALARQRTREIIEAARQEARGAVRVQRNVRGRLEGTRNDIEQALDRLIGQDTDPFDSIDVTDVAEAAAGDEGPGDDVLPPPRQGPPTPLVAPPARLTRKSIDDLPGAGDDEPLVVDLTGDDSDDRPVGGGMDAGVSDQPDPDDDGDTTAESPAMPDDSGAGDDDPLVRMVKDAVENALRRCRSDGETTGV